MRDSPEVQRCYQVTGLSDMVMFVCTGSMEWKSTETLPASGLNEAKLSAFKELEPIAQFKATAELGEFLKSRFSQSF